MNLKQFREKTLGTIVRLLPKPTFNGQPIRKEHNAWLVVDEVREAVFLLQNRSTQHEVQLGADNIQEFRTPNVLILRGQLLLTDDGKTEFEPSAHGLVTDEGLEALIEAPYQREPEQPLNGQLLQKRAVDAIEAVQLSTNPVFVLTAIPHQPTEIQGLFSSRNNDIVKLLENPKSLRPNGFDPNAGSDSRIVAGGEARRTMIPGYKLLEIGLDGLVVFVADGGAGFLSRTNKVTDQLRINQLVLIEATYLFIKFSNDVLAKADPQPRTVSYRLWLRRMTIQQPAILFPGPLATFPHGEQEAQGSDKDADFAARFGLDPRLIAFKLVAQVYRWFGFDEEKIPYKEQDSSGAWVISPDQIVDQNRRIIP